MSSTISKHESAMVHYSSYDAITVDKYFGNAKFRCVLNNCNKITNAIKVVPIMITLPNVFDNVNTYNNFFSFNFEAEDPSLQFHMIIPPGFYTRNRFIEKINSVVTTTIAPGNFPAPGVKFNFDEVENRITITNSTGYDLSITASSDYWMMLGYMAPTDYVTKTIQAGASDTAPYLPNFGGERIVHVVMKEIARGNMVTSQGTELNVLTTVSLHNTPYGSYTSKETTDIFLEDIDYKQQNNLNDVTIELLDYRYRNLIVPHNFSVHVTLKVYHVDTRR